MPWLRHIALFVVFVTALFRPAAAGAFVSAADANAQARVGAFELVTDTLVGPASGATCGLHEGIGAAYDENASGYRLAARGIPQIASGTNLEMLGQAIRHVQALEGTAAQRADLFGQLAQQISKLSGGSWSATRSVGADGSHIFAGTFGESLVVPPTGQLFRGSLATPGNFTVGPGGGLQPVYSALRATGGAP
ncbi:hypothetical protein [Sorangium sp. So ce1097]|uniref:hypothetical protein n=1 Tax=Sorangium sp. So ce1097 TaxID=3133330 RepID=UPI003F5E53D1